MEEKTRLLVERLIQKSIKISCMESCTGGQLATTITNVSGASEIFPGGFVTYGNEAKVKCGVDAEVIASFGVYSKETALAMAKACKSFYDTQIGVGITGSLGRKDPANPDSRIGEVWYAVAVDASVYKASNHEHSREMDSLEKELLVSGMLQIPEGVSKREEMKALVVATVIEELLKVTGMEG